VAIDLHTHSTASDGSEAPESIVEEAAAHRLTAVALTDHDTLEGIDEARAAATRLGIELIPGVELSVDWEGRSMHLLAYWTEPRSGPLQDRLTELQAGRDRRNAQIVAALTDMGIPITLEEVEAESERGSAGRPHIAAVLLAHGVVASVAEAFDRYLGRGRPAYRDRPRLHVTEAVHLTGASGGVTVVAHPHTIADGRDGFEKAFTRFAELGIAGVECYYVEYPPDHRLRLAALAESYGLIATGGSDFHGRYKPGIAVGVGRGDLVVPERALFELRQARRTA
jgi:predicted metal-dependent phosphoesterase TrpH